MITGVTIGEYHSYDDLRMILAKREIGFPETQTYTIEIPGRNGSLDLTDALYGTKYKDRTISLTLITTEQISDLGWPEFISGVAAKFHGQKLDLFFDEDSDWYYSGRVSIDKFETNCWKQTVTLNCVCEPYKYAQSETTYEVTGDQTVTLTNDVMPVAPTVTVTDETTITIDDSSVSLSEGTYEMTDFPLYEGDTEWEIETDGTVTITYRQGRL